MWPKTALGQRVKWAGYIKLETCPLSYLLSVSRFCLYPVLMWRYMIFFFEGLIEVAAVRITDQYSYFFNWKQGILKECTGAFQTEFPD